MIGKLFENLCRTFLSSSNAQEISRVISKICLPMLLFVIGTNDSYGQTDTFKQRGVLYFKLKDTTTFTLPKYSIDYVGEYPKFQGIIDRFEVTSIEATFQFVNNSVFDRIYRMDFNNMITAKIRFWIVLQTKILWNSLNLKLKTK
mgnify:CR=1 FL=1